MIFSVIVARARSFVLSRVPTAIIIALGGRMIFPIVVTSAAALVLAGIPGTVVCWLCGRESQGCSCQKGEVWEYVMHGVCFLGC